MLEKAMTHHIIRVREIKPEDLGRVEELTNRFFSYTYSSREKIAWRLNRGFIYLIAEMNRKIVGFIDMKIHEKDAKILGIAVDDSYMDMGIGSALLGSALELAKRRGKKKVLLKVEQCNENAINFYKRHGFNVKREVFDGFAGYVYIMQKEFEN